MKKILALCIATVCALSLFAGCAVIRTVLPCGIENVYIVSNAEKYTRTAEIEPTPETVMTASMAKNEGEGMQFILKFPEDVTGVSVTMSDLVSSDGEDRFAADCVEIYREYYTLCEGDYTYTIKGGEYYPDWLLPVNGEYTAQNTVDIPANNNQGFWITLWSGKDQTPGLYTAEVTVTYNETETIKIPVEVTVWDFAIPEELAAESLFYMDTVTEETADYLYKYRLQIGRLPISGNCYYGQYAQKCVDYIKAHPYVRTFGINLDGKTDKEITDFYNVMEANGMADYPVVYDFDEPSDTYAMNTRISESFGRNHSLNENIRNLITTASRDTMYNVDIWCGIWSSSDSDEFVVRDKQAEGYEMWWYGCVGPRNPYPTYHIQDDLISARLVQWMQKDWNITGNLFWVCDRSTIYDLDKDTYLCDDDGHYIKRDVFDDPNLFQHSDGSPAGVAGDGTFITYTKKGNEHFDADAIIPSIRLEAIRDGNEDYEYLYMLQNKIEALFDKWGVTDITADDYMDTYYDSLYNSMADFDRDPEGMLKMRERVAHDIMNADCAINVSEYLTYDNPNQRVVTVYAEPGSEVYIHGGKAAEENCGNYSVYKRIFNMNVFADKTEIEITVNGEKFTRVLKSIEDAEYIEMGKLSVDKAIDKLGLSLDKTEVREQYETNTFLKFENPNLGSLAEQVAQSGSELSVKKFVSRSDEFAKIVRSVITGDVMNDIPLVVTNSDTDLINKPSCVDLTLYVPKGATVKVEGKDAVFKESREGYSVYTATVDTGTAARYVYGVEVTYNGKTELFKRILNHPEYETVAIIDFESSALESGLKSYFKNTSSEFSVTESDGRQVITVTLTEGVSLSFGKDLIINKNLADYDKVVIDCIAPENDAEDIDIEFTTSRTSKTVSLENTANGYSGLTYGYFEDSFARSSVARITLKAKASTYDGSAAGGTYIIKGIYAVKTADEPSNGG